MSDPCRVGFRVLALAVALGLVGPGRAVAQPVEMASAPGVSDPVPPAAPAPPGYFLLPVPGGPGLFERLGIHHHERGYALMLFARALHGAAVSNPSGSLAVTFTELFGPVTVATPTIDIPADGPAVTLLAPFSDQTWRRILLLDAKADLFSALVKNRGALLVAGAALESGPGVREWLADQPRLLAQIVREWPGSFAQVAPALTRTPSGWAVPGDEPAWTALVGVPPSRTEEFLRRLLTRDKGHLARFFANLAALPDDSLAALLQGAPGEAPSSVLASFYDAVRQADAPWAPNDHPYQLSYADLPSVLHALSDVPFASPPATAGLWAALVTTTIESREDAAVVLRREPAAAPIASTVRALLRGNPRERRDRLAMLSVARRTWDAGTPADAQAELLYAVGHYRRYRGVLLMLDRLGVAAPRVWARLVDMARLVDGGGADRALRLTLVQGSLAIVERATVVGSLPPDARDRVLLALADAVERGPSPAAAVRAWLVDDLMPALPPLARPDRFSGATAYESRLLQGLGGPPAGGAEMMWEGLSYTVDPAAAEHARILQIRAQLPSPGLDVALQQSDPKPLAEALLALVYAPALGDPEGAVTLSPDVVQRHDILGVRSLGREFAWTLAVERSGSGAPWHVAGSLIGLDLALARSALRRLSADELPPVPTINLNDELTLTRTAVILQPRHFDDRTQQAIAAAIGRGRARVRDAGRDPAAVMRLMDELAVPSAVRQSATWTLRTVPDAAGTYFSLRDLLWLGKPEIDPTTLARWGVVGDSVDGRLATRFDPPIAWDRLAGRPDTGVLATQVPDLTLRLAEVTAALHVPAVTIPALLLYATQDYWHEVEARFADDWPALTRGAAVLRASRIEDYIAALGTGGPLRPR